MTQTSRGYAGHGGTPPRYGWLLKTHLALKADPDLFADPENATIALGAGAGAVKAMRYWSFAFKLSDRTGRTRTPTSRARWLLDEDTGLDPYLEDPASLWLLHWWLLTPPYRAPVWHYTFSRYPFSRFSRSELTTSAHAAAPDKVAWTSVRRDVDCLIRMYTPPTGSERSIESELLDRPLAALHALTNEDGETHINRLAGNRAPNLLLAYACLEYAARTAPNASSISLASLTLDAESPGWLLRADQPRLLRALHAAHRVAPAELEVYANGDGEEVVHYREPARAVAERLLAHHYRRHVPGHAYGTS